MASENKYLLWTPKLNSPAPNCVHTETDPVVWRPPSKILHIHKSFRKLWDFL